MNTFGSFKLECKARIRINDVCKHDLQLDDCGYCSKFLDVVDSNQSFKQVLSRARMFSPSSCVKNIREFRQNVLESRRTESIKISKIRYHEMHKESKIDTKLRIDPKQLDMMLNIHNHIILKTSKLIEKVKKSQFGGFFSPRILRKRIKLGNFSQLPCGLEVTKRRALSPCERITFLDQTNSLILKDRNETNQYIRQDSIKTKEITNKDANKSDLILNQIRNNERIQRFRSIADKYHSMQNKDASVIDDDYFEVQTKIKSNFSL